jgi:hypothetical protein
VSCAGSSCCSSRTTMRYRVSFSTTIPTRAFSAGSS